MKKPKLNTALNRLADAYRWKKLRFVLIPCVLIAVLSTYLSFGEETNLLIQFFSSFITAQSIGLSIYSLWAVFEFIETWEPLKRALGMLGIFVLGGWMGMFIAVGLVRILLDIQLTGEQLKDALIATPFPAIFFTIIISAYAILHEKLEQTAARLAEKEVSEQRLLQLKTKAELEALRAKISPHFLFNTLNSIASLIPVDPHKAEEMVQRLADLFRYTLDASRREMVRLEDELNTIHQYLEIEKVRLGDRLTFRIEMDSELADFPLPSLLLQPLVENGIKHGIAPAPQGGEIAILCRVEEKRCHIEIADSGRGFSRAEEGAGFGLHAVRERLDLHYSEECEFHIRENGGVRISIRLPFDREESLLK
jgi:sensor histidine kinase YesM